MSRAIATTSNVGSGAAGYANYEGSLRDSTLERIAEIFAMLARVTSLMSKPRAACRRSCISSAASSGVFEYRKYKKAWFSGATDVGAPALIALLIVDR